MHLQQMKSDAPSSLGFDLKNKWEVSDYVEAENVGIYLERPQQIVVFLKKNSDFLLNDMLICLFETASM